MSTILEKIINRISCVLQGAEFDVYFKYTEDTLNPFGRERLNALLDRVDVNDKLRVTLVLSGLFQTLGMSW